jgi:hypothetical protein
VTNITPQTTNLDDVGTGGKNSSRTRRINVQVRTVDAPGETCDPGETSGNQRINLHMVDDDGDVLVDSAKDVVCSGRTQHVVRSVFFQGPLNCKDSEVPGRGPPTSTGIITATGSASGTADYVNEMEINCTR